MTGCRHPENGTVQTAIVDRRKSEWMISAHAQGPLSWINCKPRKQNGKQPDVASLNYYTHYFFYYTHYFSWLTRMAVAVYTSYALQIYEKRICVLLQAKGTSGKPPQLIQVTKLFCFCTIIVIISLLLQLFFWLLPLLQMKIMRFGLEFIAKSRQIASSITGDRCS